MMSMSLQAGIVYHSTITVDYIIWSDSRRVNNLISPYLCFQLLDNIEIKMKNTCVEDTIPKLFEGKMHVSDPKIF